MPAQVLVRIERVSMHYGGVQALNGVSFDIDRGEVHALVGENGAGKSTIIKVLGGVVVPTGGDVFFDGLPLAPGSVSVSEAAGIGVIHQESTAFRHLDAVDNIFVGREIRKRGGMFLDRASMERRTRELMDRLGEPIPLRLPVGELPVARQQMVGIARALSKECRLLIMDEPTASLSAKETRVLFQIIRQLREEGVSILYVSHRLEEIFEIADRVTVLRDGEHVATRSTDELSREELIHLMVGREVNELSSADRSEVEGAKTILEVDNLSGGGFENVSFTVRAGEIMGLSGLMGAGRSEVARAIFGIDRRTRGSVIVDGCPLRGRGPGEAMRHGVGLVPEDRQHEGLVLPMTVGENLTLTVLRKLTAGPFISSPKQEEIASRIIDDLKVRTAGVNAAADTLSGGNQQKLVLGKWLATKPKLLILDEPTRGVDVGAKAEVYRLIRELASSGIAIVVISSDLPEILSLSDRIIVMCEGRVTGELPGEEAGQERLLELSLPDSAGVDARKTS